MLVKSSVKMKESIHLLLGRRAGVDKSKFRREAKKRDGKSAIFCSPFSFSSKNNDCCCPRLQKVALTWSLVDFARLPTKSVAVHTAVAHVWSASSDVFDAVLRASLLQTPSLALLISHIRGEGGRRGETLREKVAAPPAAPPFETGEAPQTGPGKGRELANVVDKECTFYC